MKFALILMIKNEEKILKRCLDAIKDVVDCYCIFDTGSTDNTVEIAKEYLKTSIGCIGQEPFRDFGYSRTQSFLSAQTFIRDTLKWNLNEVYGLLLDADMMFVQGTLKQQNLTEPGYRIIQKNGSLEYYNARIIRMDIPWKCIGVTHEYWDGPCNANLSKDICYIDDRNDGGCKHDKYERDQRLLEEGLVKEPDNGRYMFYLAQTLKCIGKFHESIDMYKKRIASGGWFEEVWYSYYMIAECYLNLKDIAEFENWSQKAFLFRPQRSEPIYKLARFFREIGHHYKCYEYIRAGEKVPYPKDDVLFIESDFYNGLFQYEKSIVEFYIHPERCLKTTIEYMLKLPHFQDNCVSNLKFSIKPLKNSKITKLDLPSPFGTDFTPSAISLNEYPMANVRYVNYLPPVDGGYRTRDGSSIQTKNAYINLDTKEFSAIEEPLVKFQSHVEGLEDLRLYNNPNGKLCFTATSFKQFIENKICIVHGEYDLETKTYKNYQAIQSPINSECEKNWVNIPGTDDFIYSWSPLLIGKIRDDRILFHKKIDTLPLFSLFRGSASPIEVNGKWLVLVHFVEYCQPRKYYHCFVELEKETYKVLRVSLPFVFQSLGIEYCISVRLVEDYLEYFVSFTDTNPSTIQSKLSDLEWIEISKPSLIKNNIIRIPSNVVIYWDGEYSKCLANNNIENYITSQKTTSKIVFSTNDGIIENDEYDRLFKNFGKSPGKLMNYKDYNGFLKNIIVTLCTRNLNAKNILLIPFDDDTFKYGLTTLLSKFYLPLWEERLPIVFWRGGSSGYDKPSTIRMKVVSKLIENKYSDVKLTKWGNWEKEHNIPENHFGDRCALTKHFLFKYLLIIDGACIASNHQWVFGSGSVPIMVTHPDNNWWFKKYLIPMKHYVPISYDLSDLEEKIQWLLENDDKAKEIVNNAMEFSKEVFSPEFQRNYINEELKRINQDLN